MTQADKSPRNPTRRQPHSSWTNPNELTLIRCPTAAIAQDGAAVAGLCGVSTLHARALDEHINISPLQGRRESKQDSGSVSPS